MKDALARHDVVMRGAIVSNHGLVFKTIGDAFCAAFPTERDGVGAAVAAQSALASEPWGVTGPLRARMAIHCGAVNERDNDYFGPPVNRVARLLSLGHGGQVLLSEPVWKATQSDLPESVGLRDLGKHRLRDIGHREHICQLLIPGQPAVFPKLKTPPSAIPGALAGLLVALLALALYPVATGAADFSLSLFSPRSLVDNLTGLVVGISIQRDTLLLILALALPLATGIAFAVWRHRARVRHHRGSHVVRLVGRRVGLRGVAFFAVVTLAIGAAYAYQQYLWNVKLPVPAGKLGLALTRGASAASFNDEEVFALTGSGAGKQVVLRQLPVDFDTSDLDQARKLGRRIGAKAVLIYREDGSDETGEGRYVAAIVFTNPNITVSGLGRSGEIGDTAQAAPQESGELELGAGVATLHAGSRDAVVTNVFTAAAGIIAYHESQFPASIALFAQTHPEDLTVPNAGIVNIYLARA